MSGDVPTMAFVSHVLPFPANMGQSCRVRDFLSACRERFHVVFLGFAEPDELATTQRALEEHADEVRLLPARLAGSLPAKTLRRVARTVHATATGLKGSNFDIGVLNLSPDRIRELVGDDHFDVAVFQYWHATPAVDVFTDRGVPVALDMHNVLWRSREAELQSWSGPRRWLGQVQLGRYRERELAAWRRYDALIAINDAEADEAHAVAPDAVMINAPMGVDLDRWPHDDGPGERVLAFYGGMGGERGARDARRCHDEIMPIVWDHDPDCRLWLLGSNPPEDIRALAADERVWVPGFVEDLAATLHRVRAVLCPFTGTYGFRSRIVELLSAGTPVVCSPDAVYGMGLAEAGAVAVGDDSEALARLAIELLDHPDRAQELSRTGRRAVEDRYSFDATYGHLADELATFAASRSSSERTDS